ncbi:MAG: hypothetical protein IIC83_07730 [Chloroflexi bacterium]|nr:hypothetical protein [Chloroflexota bacterium]
MTTKSTSNMIGTGNTPVVLEERVANMKALASEIHKEFTAAGINLEIIERIRKPSVQNSVNRYRAFFAPTLMAHVNMFAIRMDNLTTKRPRPVRPSVHRILVELDKDSELRGNVDVAFLKSRLDILRADVLKRVIIYCQKRAAHNDLEGEIKSVEYREMRPLYEELKGIFVDACDEPTGTTYEMNLPGMQLTTRLLEALDKQGD